MDSSGHSWISISDADLLRMRLCDIGVELENYERLELALVDSVKQNRSKLHAVICTLLSSAEDSNREASSSTSDELTTDFHLHGSKHPFHETERCIEWLIFENDPEGVYADLRSQKGDTQGVCGAVWGSNDIAYRCRTCEQDPTCAICVACFNAGDHKNHDYSMIHTGGGCCDCGDETAWKSEGFCSRHKGPGQVQPLPEKYAQSAGPVLEFLLLQWKERLLFAERKVVQKPKELETESVRSKVAENITSMLVEMFLRFCECSESLMNFVAKLVCASTGLLDVLLRTERFLSKETVSQLHELLFKFLGEPNFKFEFAKAFIRYYPSLFTEMLKEASEAGNSSPGTQEYPILSNFSVQIFTVPTLTPRLVIEANLLDMLLGNLKQLFISCAGEDGRLVASKSLIVKQVYARLIEDIRYVMSHLEVAKYVASERPALSKEWLYLLTYLQGMDPQKRATSVNVEEESDYWFSAFLLEMYVAHIHPLYIAGVASVPTVKEEDSEGEFTEHYDSDEDKDITRHAKIGRLSEESSVTRMTGRSNVWEQEGGDMSVESIKITQENAPPSLSTSLKQFIYECTRILDGWLVEDVRKSHVRAQRPSDNSSSRRLPYWRGRGVRGTMSASSYPSIREGSAHSLSTDRGGRFMRGLFQRTHQTSVSDTESDEDRRERILPVAMRNMDSGSDMDIDTVHDEEFVGEALPNADEEISSVLKSKIWPMINYDVSSQGVSFHIPLHRMLALLLHKAMEQCSVESVTFYSKHISPFEITLGSHCDIFGKLFGEFHPNGFSAYVMEHPLRIQVLCAQVRAGMWRRNGHSTLSLCEYYHSVRWYEDSLELDLFLLQCCAAIAPPEEFVRRILERFNLVDYLSLHLARPNEYEPVLVQAMLALLIRIVAERALCGLSTEETLKRELIRKLSVGDATHSQLLKALPDRLADNKNLQNILDTVALYVHPSGMQQGKYILRKEFWKELDLYHPRWSLKELQSVEERYFHYCKASAMVMQTPRWRDPFYPLMPISRIATSLGVLEITRAVVFYAVCSENISDSRAPDGVLFTALHLLALGLDFCSSLMGKTITGTTADDQHHLTLLLYANQTISVGSVDNPELSGRQSLLSLLVLLMKKHEKGMDQGISAEPNNQTIAALVRNLLQKFSELDNVLLCEIQKLAPGVVQSKRIENIKANDLENGDAGKNLSDADRKKALARERQAAIMAKMKAAQASFAASFNGGKDIEEGDVKRKNVLDVEESLEGPSNAVCSLCHESGSTSSIALLSFTQRSRLLSIAANGPPSWDMNNQSAGDDFTKLEEEQEQESERHGQIFSSVGFWDLVQSAIEGNYNGTPDVDDLLNFLRIELPVVYRSADQQANTDDSDTSTSREWTDNLLGGNGRDKGKSVISNSADADRSVVRVIKKGITGSGDDSVSVVLAEYVAFVSKLMSEKKGSTENSTDRVSMESSINPLVPTFDGFGPINCDGIHISSCGHCVHQECLERYLHSVRQRYNNRIIFEGVHIVDPDQGEFLCPVCRRLVNSSLPVLAHKPAMNLPENFLHLSSVDSLTSSSNKIAKLDDALAILRDAEEMFGKPVYRKQVSCELSEPIRRAIGSLYQKLCPFYSQAKRNSNARSVRLNQSLIIWDLLRYGLLSAELASRSSGDSSPRFSKKPLSCSKGFVLQLLCQIAQATQSKDRLTVLLRARGLQLIVGSICLGVSRDSSGENSRTDNISSLLGCIDNSKCYLDIPFWKRMADPILIHDPFSSLLWLLFCLPHSLADTIEALKALVHLFYLVCLIQAVAHAGNLVVNREYGLSPGCAAFVMDILGRLSGTVLSQSPLASNDPILVSCSTNLLIRRLTLPYLRRCALLFDLLISSAKNQEIAQRESSSMFILNNYQQNGEELSLEVEEVARLENLLEVQTLDTILEDRNVRELVMRWCEHLSKETGSRTFKYVVRADFARPFELMRLPHLYQDLLQRYIKERCPSCKRVFEHPSLCLLCGRVCCALSRSACCRRNSCSSHAKVCGAGFGVFLMTKRTSILLQRSTRQAPWPSPYLDAFGEEDLDLSRGKPLYLSKERYSALTNMVASHGLDHNPQVLLQTTRDTVFLI